MRKKVKTKRGTSVRPWATIVIEREQYEALRQQANTPPRESVSAIVRRIVHRYLHEKDDQVQAV